MILALSAVAGAVVFTAGAVIFMALLFAAAFRFVRPSILMDDYVVCAGGWHEAELNSCSQGLLKLPQQPVNTYSNLAYLAAGLFPAIVLKTPPAYVFAATTVYLCVGSSLYHAFSTRWAGMLDVTGIYTVFSALATYSAAVLIGLPDWLTSLLMFVIAGLAAYFLSPRYKQDMHLRIGIFLGLAYGLTLLHMGLSGNWGAWPYLLASFLLFALAFLIWNLDKKRTFPLHGWGHGFWHVFTAAGAALLFYATFLSSL